MDILAGFLVLAGPVALAVRGIIDGIRRLVDPKSNGPSVLWVVLAFAIGVVVALVFRLDYAATVVIGGNTANLSKTAGEIVTGLGIGGVAMFWNTVLAKRQAETKAIAGEVPDGTLAEPRVAQR